MKIENKKWNKREKEFQTSMNQLKFREAKRLVEKIENDPEKEERLNQQVCKICFYSSLAAFCAMTYANCGVCNNETLYSSSDFDKLCQRCATMHEACKHCGGEMD